MNKMNILLAAVLVLAVAEGAYLFSVTGKAVASDQLDSFAKCLTESGAKMYGAFWCPHCNEQKKDFGDSWKHIEYIECSTPDGKGQTGECRAAGIQGYPTWEFADGSRESGTLPLEFLSEKTSCPLLQE